MCVVCYSTGGIWVLGIIILLLVVLAGGMNLLFTERFPDEGMRKALSFLRNDDILPCMEEKLLVEQQRGIFGDY